MNEFEKAELMCELKNILSPVQYQLIILRFYENRTVEETCRMLKLGSIRGYYRLWERIDKKALKQIACDYLRYTKRFSGVIYDI